MSRYADALPEVVRARVVTHGAQGRAWLDSLDSVVAKLAKRWQLEIGEIMHGGSEALVLAVRQVGGTAAVLKLCLPDDTGIVNERLTLQLAAGRGYARLLQADEVSGALLVERLGSSVAQSVRGDDAQLATILETLTHAWVAMDAPQGLTSAAAKAQWLENFISSTYPRLDAPCARGTVEQAVKYARARRDAHRPNEGFLLHGDAHEENTLADPERSGRFKFIDPDGLYGEKACDLASLMRDWNGPLRVGDTRDAALKRCHWLADATASDPSAVWQWGFIERVSTGFVMLNLGMRDEGAETLSIADEIASVAV